ncbi:MAG: hypothetical protein WBA12_05530 [Catalinimonas sp.]
MKRRRFVKRSLLGALAFGPAQTAFAATEDTPHQARWQPWDCSEVPPAEGETLRIG